MASILQCIRGCLLLWQLMKLSCLPLANHTDCIYPPGSIACKLYNRTSLDCILRNLVCIPSLPHNASLEELYLRSNELSYLPDNAFRGLQNLQILFLNDNALSFVHSNAFIGLRKLQSIDLSYNRLKNLTGSPFRDLDCLQHLVLSYNEISSFNNEMFAGLNSLKKLDFSNNPLVKFTDNPFIGLVSLHTLDISFDSEFTGTTSKGIFTGLDKLENIDLKFNNQDRYFDLDDLCSLRSLEKLSAWGHLNLTNNCIQKIPLKSLTTRRFTYHLLLNEKLIHLTSIDIQEDSHTVFRILNSLDSLLEEITISFSESSAVILNSTTFESWAKWNLSLHTLDMTSNMYHIEGAPFAWVPKLRVLRLNGYLHQELVIQTFPKDTFNGLEQLEELHLEYFKLTELPTDALSILSSYKVFKVLSLAHNEIYGEINLQPFCSMLSLSKLDLSYNAMSSIAQNVPKTCKLQSFYFGNQDLPVFKKRICFHCLCQQIPYLNTLDATESELYNITGKCQNLNTLRISKSYISGLLNADVPNLTTLHLYDLVMGDFLKQLISLVTPRLTYLDLGSNHITEIDREDALFFQNLTYLDLSNNDLASVGNLQYLVNIETLRLNGNKITSIPRSFLTKSSHPHLVSLFLGGNPFLCDCSIEAFRKWIITDDMVSLSLQFDPTYLCFAPKSRIGLSITAVDLHCASSVWRNLAISIPCVLITIIVAILLIRYRWHIQYKLFLLVNRRRNYQNYIENDDDADDDDEDENGIPRFDAYVAYHLEDEDWVDGELLPNIEEGEEPFRLCIKDRDVRAGSLLIRGISLSIQRSRKTLIVLTPRFVESEWCYFQLSMAHQRLLEEGHNVLILILLEDIPNNKLTLILRQLFCKAQCLKWPGDGYGQYLFWCRLREELKRPVLIDRRFEI